MEKIIITAIITLFLFIEVAILLTPHLIKRKIQDYKPNSDSVTYIQRNQIVINETDFDNFDSKILIANHLDEIQQEENYPVYIVKNDSEEQLGYDSFKQLNPEIDPNKPFLIKPNIGGITSIKKGADNGVLNRITSPIFVGGIIKYLKEKGVKDIAIGESWGMEKPEMIQELFQISGYQKLADEFGIKLIDLNYYNEGNLDNYPVKIKYPDAKLLKNNIYVSKTYLKYLANGVIINVPKLKTHRFAVASLSLKNMMGVLMMEGNSHFLHANKSGMHKEIKDWYLNQNLTSSEQKQKYIESYQLFSERLIDLYVAVKPDFTIVEGYIGTEGDGFDKIKTREEHVAFAGKNAINVDFAASSYMGFIGSSYLKNKFGFDSPLYIKEGLQRFYNLTASDLYFKIINSDNLEFSKPPFLLTPLI